MIGGNTQSSTCTNEGGPANKEALVNSMGLFCLLILAIAEQKSPISLLWGWQFYWSARPIGPVSNQLLSIVDLHSPKMDFQTLLFDRTLSHPRFALSLPLSIHHLRHLQKPLIGECSPVFLPSFGHNWPLHRVQIKSVAQAFTISSSFWTESFVRFHHIQKGRQGHPNLKPYGCEWPHGNFWNPLVSL